MAGYFLSIGRFKEGDGVAEGSFARRLNLRLFNSLYLLSREPASNLLWSLVLQRQITDSDRSNLRSELSSTSLVRCSVGRDLY